MKEKTMMTLETLINFVLMSAVGGGILWYERDFFLLYAFMVVVGLIMFFSIRLWKLIHATHLEMKIRVTAIGRKLGLSDADYAALVSEEPFARDFRELL